LIALHYCHVVALFPIDLVKGSAIAEVFRLRFLPSAASLHDGEGIYLWKLARVLLRRLLQARAIEVPCLQVLCFRRIEILKVSACNLLGTVPLGYFVDK
jgi:hypothetical protein